MKLLTTAAFILKEPGWEKLADIIVNAITVDMAIKESMNAVWKAYKNKRISEESAKVKEKALIELAKSSLRVL
ncbi:MAG: hypothetical protein ACPL07_04020 [Candidatus Bathyarchaeia archaeon]